MYIPYCFWINNMSWRNLFTCFSLGLYYRLKFHLWRDIFWTKLVFVLMWGESDHITSWQIDGGKVETMIDFLLEGGSKITVDDGCRHAIQRHLFLERKSMTNLNSTLKSRDITLSNKFHIAKAMLFPVVMYGYERRIIKKAEQWRIDAFKLWCWRKLLRVSWTARRSNQSILKETNPGHSFEGLGLKLQVQYFVHLMRRANSLEKTLMLGNAEGRRRRGWQRMTWLDVFIDSMDMSLITFWVLVMNREAWCAAFHGVTQSWTWLSDWTDCTYSGPLRHQN